MTTVTSPSTPTTGPTSAPIKASRSTKPKAQHPTPAQALDVLIEFFKESDDIGRDGMAAAMTMLLRNPESTRAANVAKIWFAPVAKESAQVFQFPARKKEHAAIQGRV